jgi:putative flippase GtrA
MLFYNFVWFEVNTRMIMFVLSGLVGSLLYITLYIALHITLHIAYCIALYYI